MGPPGTAACAWPPPPWAALPLGMRISCPACPPRCCRAAQVAAAAPKKNGGIILVCNIGGSLDKTGAVGRLSRLCWGLSAFCACAAARCRRCAVLSSWCASLNDSRHLHARSPNRSCFTRHSLGPARCQQPGAACTPAESASWLRPEWQPTPRTPLHLFALAGPSEWGRQSRSLTAAYELIQSGFTNIKVCARGVAPFLGSRERRRGAAWGRDTHSPRASARLCVNGPCQAQCSSARQSCLLRSAVLDPARRAGHGTPRGPFRFWILGGAESGIQNLHNHMPRPSCCRCSRTATAAGRRQRRRLSWTEHWNERAPSLR